MEMEDFNNVFIFWNLVQSLKVGYLDNFKFTAGCEMSLYIHCKYTFLVIKKHDWINVYSKDNRQVTHRPCPTHDGAFYSTAD
jgi:hypothetical protein